MAYYRLYFVQRGHFVRFEEIEAEEDGAAIEAAGRRAGPLALELWCGRRRVRSFEAVPKAAAAETQNPAAARGEPRRGLEAD